MAEFFDTWGSWLAQVNESLSDKPIFFGPTGVAQYRTENFEMLIHRGPLIDPAKNEYTSTVQSFAYDSYVPQDGDYVELIVHTPFQTYPDPYG